MCYILLQAKDVAGEKARLRSEVLKQIREFFDLKQLGAITEEEYDEKRKILLKDI